MPEMISTSASFCLWASALSWPVAPGSNLTSISPGTKSAGGVWALAG